MPIIYTTGEAGNPMTVSRSGRERKFFGDTIVSKIAAASMRVWLGNCSRMEIRDSEDHFGLAETYLGRIGVPSDMAYWLVDGAKIGADYRGVRFRVKGRRFVGSNFQEVTGTEEIRRLIG